MYILEIMKTKKIYGMNILLNNDLEEIKKKDYLLLPGIYTYQEEKPQDPQEIKKEIKKLSSEILETFHKSFRPAVIQLNRREGKYAR